MAAVNELVAWLLTQIDYDEQVAMLAGRGSRDELNEDRRRIIAQCQVWLEGEPSTFGGGHAETTRGTVRRPARLPRRMAPITDLV